MIKHVLVLPFAYQLYADECFAYMSHKINALLIDNTSENKGVAPSWNMGVDEMRKINADWLIVCSAAIRFGEPGGADMLDALEKHPNAQIVNFAQKDFPTGQQFIRGKTVGVEDGMFSWHLCAINRHTFDDIGKFDANFYPSYFEDLDYDLRLRKFYGDKLDWPIEPIDAKSIGVGHAVKLGGIKTPVNDLIAYFATKWGRHPSAAQLGEYNLPFNDENNSLAFWPPARGQLYDE